MSGETRGHPILGQLVEKYQELDMRARDIERAYEEMCAGVVNLSEEVRGLHRWRRDGRVGSPCILPLRGRSHPCYLIPDLKAMLTLGTVFPRIHTMPP